MANLVLAVLQVFMHAPVLSAKSGSVTMKLTDQRGGNLPLLQLGAAPTSSLPQATVEQKLMRNFKQNLKLIPATEQRKTFALGFHGQYQRLGDKREGHYDRNGRPYAVTSDYFACADNINANIIDPLKQMGATVYTYVDTITFDRCPEHDQHLLAALKPRKYRFADKPHARVVDSYMGVTRMILEDDRRIDFVILLRFDVMYAQPITEMNIRWDIANGAFKDFYFAACGMISDLFFVFPLEHAVAMIDAFDQSGKFQGDDKTDCTKEMLGDYFGAGHWTYIPFIKKMGEDKFNFIDDFECDSMIDGITESTDLTFLWISRTAGPDIQKCDAKENPAATSGAAQRPSGASPAFLRHKVGSALAVGRHWANTHIRGPRSCNDLL